MTKRSRTSSRSKKETSPLTILGTILIALIGLVLSALGIGGNLFGTQPTATPERTAQVRPTRDSGPSSPVAVEYPPMPAKSRLTRATVLRVVDGDTVEVKSPEGNFTLRLIGMNTPETVAPNQPRECFGREASDRAKALIKVDSVVYLEADESQDNRDRYNRLLRYLWFEDGRLFNMQMIAEGYAWEYTYQRAYKYQAAFRAAQREADQRKRGLWSPNTCNGERKPVS